MRGAWADGCAACPIVALVAFVTCQNECSLRLRRPAFPLLLVVHVAAAAAVP